jgi:ABC-type transport system involved in cytochrome c biogenesis permease component
MGGHLFGALNATLFLSIWILVPLLTADIISREKREGTLGLLFLTPLTPFGIVLGKTLIQGLRAVTLYLAVLPALAVPFLLGGVTWKDGAVSLLLNSSALVLALAAGLVASTLTSDSRRALALALVISLGLEYGFMVSHFASFFTTANGFAARPLATPMHPSQLLPRYLLSRIEVLVRINTGVGWLDIPYPFRSVPAEGWRFVWLNFPPAFHAAWLRCLVWLFLKSLLGFTGIAALAAWQVRRTWRSEPTSLRAARLQAFFCAPRLWKSVFRSKMRGLLARNPIGWLQQYSWNARVVKWGWCLGVVVVECAFVTDPSLSNVWEGQYILALLLALGMAFTASGSFRLERQSGALELLLVTPLRVSQILGGRIRGVWGQFMPATAIVAAAWLWLLREVPPSQGPGGVRDIEFQLVVRVLPLFFATSFILLPAIGLFFSLQRLHFIGAWLLTCCCGLLLPALNCLWLREIWPVAVMSLFATQLGMALTGRSLLHRNLTDRKFALGLA